MLKTHLCFKKLFITFNEVILFAGFCNIVQFPIQFVLFEKLKIKEDNSKIKINVYFHSVPY